MGIGSMRDRVVFKAPVDFPLDGGGFVTEFVFSFEEWTKVEPLSSRRTLQDNQIELVDGMRFNVRYRSSPQPTKSMLVEYEGKKFTINSIVEVDQRKRYWQIVALTTGDPVETT